MIRAQILLTSALTVLLASALLLAEESRPAPKELARLKTNYHAAISKAVTPISATYRKELQKLLESYTRSGDLDAALLVKSELSSLDGAPSPLPAGGTDETTPQGDVNMPKSIADTIWTSKTGVISQLHFKPDGILVVSTKFGKTYTGWKYTVTSDGSVTILPSGDGAKPATFRFTKRGGVFEGMFPDWKTELKLETIVQ